MRKKVRLIHLVHNATDHDLRAHVLTYGIKLPLMHHKIKLAHVVVELL